MNYPSSWETVTIGESLELINGRAFKPTEWVSAGRPIIRIQNLNNLKAAYNYYAGELPEKFLVATGDLLFAWSGTPGTSFGAHIWKGPEAWLNQHIFKVVFPREVFDKAFLQFAINQNLSQYIGVAHGGAGLAHITKGKFEGSSIPLPPLPEQKRIVAKIEELFSELEAGEASLRKARRQLGVYRQSLLKQAFEGKLTAQWRTQNPDKLESPATLTDAIQARSRDAKFSANERHEIPSWAYRTLDELTESVTSGSRGWADYYAGRLRRRQTWSESRQRAVVAHPATTPPRATGNRAPARRAVRGDRAERAGARRRLEAQRGPAAVHP